MKFPDCEKQKLEKKYVPNKTIIQDSIYVVRQFVYIHQVVGISLF